MKIKKYKYILLGILCVVLATGYFYLFFQKGIEFEDSFLKLSQSNNMYQYKGSVYGQDILITVEGNLRERDSAIITYAIEDFDTRVYTVKVENWLGKNADVKIFDGFGQIYEGSYRPTILINKDGSLYIEETKITYYNNDVSIFDEDYKISYSHIVSTALKDSVSNRGKGALLFYALLIMAIHTIDVIWPLFFFNIRYGYAVRKPEPSDRYLVAQRISRFIYPIIAIMLLIASLS